MNLTRRELVLAGLGLVVSGCAASSSTVSQRPGNTWPSAGSAPPRPVVHPPIAQPPAGRPVGGGVVASPLGALPRSQWAKADPIPSRLSAMNGVRRITLHHEGYRTVHFADVASTKDRLELIRRSHLSRMRAGDIGYHFVIDRAGRVWEGRPIQYQGAHAGGANNANNVGVMVLGNFDEQTPTDAQMASMTRTIRALQQIYRVPRNQIFSHQELGPTRCPGAHLQPRFAALRHNGTFA